MSALIKLFPDLTLRQWAIVIPTAFILAIPISVIMEIWHAPSYANIIAGFGTTLLLMHLVSWKFGNVE